MYTVHGMFSASKHRQSKYTPVDQEASIVGGDVPGTGYWRDLLRVLSLWLR